MTDGRVRVGVLGPLRVERADGTDVTPAGLRQRRLLALLVLRRGSVVSTDALVEAIWGDQPPRDPGAALQTHVFRLRQALPVGAIDSLATGYRLDPGVVDVDADRLAAAVAAALADGGSDPAAVLAALDGHDRGAVDPAAMPVVPAAPDGHGAAAGFGIGVGWDGPAYPELADTDDGRAEASRLDGLRLQAAEARLQALLDLGRAAEVVGEAAALVGEAPLRERPRSLLMAALAATGRRVEALRAYDDFRRLLGDELGIEPSPALAAQHASLLAAAAPAAPTGPELPVPPTTLVGREQLAVETVAMVGSERLLTLLGTGGVGKTRLLLEVGRRLQHHRPDRPVVLCELAGATPGTVLDVVAMALGVDLRVGGHDDPRDHLATVLRAGETVLLLDNCEHVLDPVAELVERVLARTGSVRILTTSRERLRVAGEQVVPVPPLPVPRQRTDDVSGRGAPTPSSVELFVARARAVRPDFAPSGDELTRVADIVRRLDGLPLAIELAAARLQTMSIDEVAAGLDRRFHLLTSGVRTTTRHRSLAAAVTWSYGLLDPELQRLLVDLSIFAGPFTAEDAAAVHLGDQDSVDLDIVASLAELAERSLVSRAPGGDYVLLETLRAFGTDELERAGRRDAVASRHAAHLLRWAERVDQRLRAPDSETVLEEVDAALPDLRIAFDWFVDHGDVDGAARLVTALQDYGFFRVRPEVLLWADRVWGLDADGEHPLMPLVWAAGAMGSWISGDLVENGRRARRALELVPAGVEPPVQVLQMQGSHTLFDGRLDESAAWYEEALRASSGDLFDEAVSAGCVVLALAYAGDPSVRDRARSLLDMVDGWCSAAAAYAWYTAGEAELGGDQDVALQRFDHALDLAERTGCSFVTGVAGSSAASIEARVGDPQVAAARYRTLLHHWRRAGMWSTQWTMLRSIAGLLERLGRHRDAAVLLGAVTSTREGHRVFGEDATTLAELDATLRKALGEATHRDACAEGARLDGEGAVEHALRALAG